MEQQKLFNEVVDNIQNYLETQKQLMKLEVVQKVSEASSTAAAGSIVFIFYLLVFLFFSIAIALLAGDLFGKMYLGFAAVALIYLIIALLLNINKEKWLKNPIANSFIKSFLKHE